MKVELIYLKDKLYCYSDNHEYVKKFLSQRNQKLFKVIKCKMNKNEFKIFDNTNYQIKLCEILLFDGIDDMYIIGTNNEDFRLTIASDEIYDTINSINTFYQFKNDILKDKILKSIKYLTNTIVDNTLKKQEFKINTLNLFYNLFKNTFSDIDKNILIEK